MQAKDIAEKMIHLLENHQFGFSDKAKHVLEMIGERYSISTDDQE